MWRVRAPKLPQPPGPSGPPPNHSSGGLGSSGPEREGGWSSALREFHCQGDSPTPRIHIDQGIIIIIIAEVTDCTGDLKRASAGVFLTTQGVGWMPQSLTEQMSCSSPGHGTENPSITVATVTQHLRAAEEQGRVKTEGSCSRKSSGLYFPHPPAFPEFFIQECLKIASNPCYAWRIRQ